MDISIIEVIYQLKEVNAIKMLNLSFNKIYYNIVKNILKRFIRIKGEILKNKLIKIELTRAIKSKTMALVLFLGLLITVSQIFTYVIPIVNFNESVVVDNYPMASPTTVFQAWIGNINILPQSYIFFALFGEDI